MNMTISHARTDESPAAKAQWFQSLSLAERMEWLCWMTDLIFTAQPHIGEKRDAQSLTGRVLVLAQPSR